MVSWPTTEFINIFKIYQMLSRTKHPFKLKILFVQCVRKTCLRSQPCYKSYLRLYLYLVIVRNLENKEIKEKLNSFYFSVITQLLNSKRQKLES